MQTLQNLINTKALQFARLPAGNPTSLGFPAYTISLIGEDYHAATPVMWNAAYQQLGFTYGNIMLVGDPGSAEEFFSVLRADTKYIGGGCGVGFKEVSSPFLDELDSTAAEVGAVNFVLKTDGGNLRGYNTDALGYAESLEDVFAAKGQTLSGKKVLLIGAGGTGSAVSFALASKGAFLTILNRTVSKAESIASRVNSALNLLAEQKVEFGGEEQIALQAMQADAIVNVSTKGATGALQDYSALAPADNNDVAANLAAADLVLKSLKAECIVSDVNLAKGPTSLIRTAEQAGFTVLDGKPMVVNQAVEAFFILHGQELEAKGIGRSQVREIMRYAATH